MDHRTLTNGIMSLPLDLVDELEIISDIGFTFCSQDELDAFAASSAMRRPPSPSNDSAASAPGIGIDDRESHQVEERSVGSLESSSSTTSSGKKIANFREGLMDLVRKEWEMSDPKKMIAVSRNQMT